MALPVLFNLWTLRAQVVPVQNLNDANMHYSMLRWATGRIQHGHLPFDGWYPYLGQGFPQFHHYQSLPHIIGGALGVIIGPSAAFFGSLYLLLALWPICVYASARLFGMDRWSAAAAAVVSPLLISASGYGFEQGSYTWQGFGMWAQLWGMWAFPFALALGYRAVQKKGSVTLAAFALGLTLALHFLVGYLAAVALAVWVLARPNPIRTRLGRAALVGAGALGSILWMLVPLLSDTNSANYSNYGRGTFWYDSYGAQKVLGWLVSGDIYDKGRLPIITILFAVGLVLSVIRARTDVLSRALVGFWTLSMVLFIGRPTFGAALNVLPGHRDLFLPRFIVGVHLGGIFLAGIGAAWLGKRAIALTSRIRFRVPSWAPAAAIAVLAVVVLYPAWHERAVTAGDGTTWTRQQRAADRTEGADLRTLIDRARDLGGARVYAGLRTNWGRTNAIAFVPAYAELVNQDIDSVGFTLRVASLATPAEQFFDDTKPDQYDLYNVGYLILPADHAPPSGAQFVASAGTFRLYAMPTTGYLEVVDTIGPAIVATGETLGAATTPFLDSADLKARRFPTIALNGQAAGEPSATGPETGSAGSVGDRYSSIEDGVFGATVTANRDAAVLLKASFHSRWHATINGEAVPTQLVAPGFVTARVPAGTHEVRFEYQPYPHYWVLFLLSLGSLVGLAFIERRFLRRYPLAPDASGA